MKNMEKIIPAVAVSLAVAGVGGADALATELDTTAQVPAETPEVTPAAANTMDTQIHTLTESGTEETKETKEAEETEESARDAGKKLDANLSVDINGDGTVDATFNGQLSADTTPQPPVTDPVTGDVTNTENTNINGSIGATIPGTPFAEDQELADGVAGSGDDIKETDEQGNKSFSEEKFQSAIKDTFQDHFVEDSFKQQDDGTYTFQTSHDVPKPLSDEERDTILAASGITRNAAGQYVNAAGTAVNVRWDEDRSTVTNTTTWTIIVEEGTKTSDEQDAGSVDSGIVTLPGSDPLEGEESDELGVDEIVQKEGVTWSEDGTVATYTEGTKTYTLTYRETDAIDVSDYLEDGDLSNEFIYKNLLKEAAGYTYDDVNDIIKDAAGHVLTFKLDGLTAKVYTVELKVVDTQGDQSGETYTEADKVAAEEEAKRKAAENAAKNLAGADATVTVIKNADGTYTATWTKDGKAHTATVEITRTSESDDWTVAVKDGHSDDATTTVKGEAVVKDEEIVWSTETGATDGLTISGGKVVFSGTTFNGEAVEGTPGVDANGNTTITTKTTDGKTKVYTFTYEAVSGLSDAEKAALLAGLEGKVDVTDFTGLNRISWTVKVSTPLSGGPVDGFKDTVIVGDSDMTVTKVDDETYTVKEGDKTYALKKGSDGKFHNTDTTDKADYTIVDQTVDMNALLAELQKKYPGKTLTLAADGKTITYTDTDNRVVTVDYTTAKYSIKKVESSSQDLANTKKQDLIQSIITEINKDPNASYSANGHKLKVENGKLMVSDGTDDDIIWMEFAEEHITWIKSDTAVNFDSMDPAELAKYLESLKQQTVDAGKNHDKLDHVDLDSGSSLIEEETGKKYDCVILPGKKDDPDNRLTFTWSHDANVIVNGGGTSQNITNSITKDGNHYEFGHDVINPHPTSSSYYKVEGKVGYDFVRLYGRNEEQKAKDAVAALKREGFDGAGYVKIGSSYQVYRKTGSLTAYGYMSYDYNNCSQKGHEYRGEVSPGKGYDLFLDELTLLKDGRVIGSNTKVESYNVTLNKVATTEKDSKASLTVTDLTKEGGSKVEDGQGGDALYGSYQITETKTRDDLKKDHEDKDYEGEGTATYDKFKAWVETTDTFENAGDAVQFAGGLKYTYDVRNDTVTVTGETNANRNIDADVTTSTVTPGTTTPTTPDEGGTGGDTTIDGGETPLAELPDEEVPLAELPEEAEEDEVEIPDDEVPLAEVPMTGDISPLWTLAAALSVGGLSVLSMLRKKRRG